MLAVIAVLAGASFLGGGMALGRMATAGFTGADTPGPSADPGGDPSAEESPTPRPTPTEESTPTEEPLPTDEPSLEAEELITAEELIDELRRDFDIEARADVTEDICTVEDEEDEAGNLFQCTSAMDTNLVRAVAFDGAGIALFAAMALEESEDTTAADIQDACHFVLIWFDESGMDQGERDDMADSTREAAGCP
ncbi:hypothetical protein ACFWTE_10365 [Nocardiopsis sp. NPDC058631]|uniref:hypothetical protein n=1 Tax=Nocardiopsis sp. NPDC058631 TaxID=3346566 RepID=UPI0036504185